jgi:hypothetical protein
MINLINLSHVAAKYNIVVVFVVVNLQTVLYV